MAGPGKGSDGEGNCLPSELRVCNMISVGFEYRFFAEGALVPASMLPVMIGLVSSFMFGLLYCS